MFAIPPVPTTVVAKSKYDDLIQWMVQDKGCMVDSRISIAESERGGGYGAFVTDDIEEGTVLFQVSRSACVTLDNVLADEACGPEFTKLIEKAGPGGNTVAMAGFLAKEYLLCREVDSSSASSFGPYLETLPWQRGINQQEHVLFWSDDMMDDLKGTFCYPESTGLRDEVLLASRVLNDIVGPSIRTARNEETEKEDESFQLPWEKKKKPNLPPVEGLSDAVKGAFVTLLTRGFEDDSTSTTDPGDISNSDDDEKTAVVAGEEKLVPLLDMLQHSDEPNISHAMRKQDGVVEVRARKAIPAGSELLNQYRAEEEETMAYHRFFSRFGFVPGINEPIADLIEDKSSIFFPKKVEV